MAELPDGLDTLVGADGELVSGRTAPAHRARPRAALADARFLILDEPTAHLDAPLAERVTRNALAYTRGRGVLLIAHSTAGTKSCNRILRLRDGVVADAA